MTEELYGTRAIREAKLEAFDNRTPERDYTIQFTIPEFTCLCPISGFPDFATLHIRYVPGPRCVELKSLKLYINGYRDRNVYHEDVVNVVLDDLVRCSTPLLRGGRRLQRPRQHQDRRASTATASQSGPAKSIPGGRQQERRNHRTRSRHPRERQSEERARERECRLRTDVLPEEGVVTSVTPAAANLARPRERDNRLARTRERTS